MLLLITYLYLRQTISSTITKISCRFTTLYFKCIVWLNWFCKRRFLFSHKCACSSFLWGNGERTIVVGMQGIHDTEAPTRAYEVDLVLPHEDYNPSNYNDHDIMLLKLKNSIEFTDEVSPVCLPKANEEFSAGTRCYTTGWGDLMCMYTSLYFTIEISLSAFAVFNDI